MTMNHASPIPPSAPPVLAEEPATHMSCRALAALRFDGDSLHYLNRYQAIAIRNLLTDYDALLAQARQGREDAERLRESVPDWWCQCGGRAYRSTAIGWQCTFCYAVYPATPSPSPEGGNAL